MTQKLESTSRAIVLTSAPPSGIFTQLCRKVSETLVAAQHKTSTERKELLGFLQEFRNEYIETYQAQEINLPTLNGTTINGLHFHGTQKKALIYLHGNGYFCETGAEKPLGWREGLKISLDGVDHYPHLIVCNTGGTGKSEGNTHPFTVAYDLLAQFEYLVKEHGIDPSCTAIVGYSQGGFLSAFGAALIQQKFPQATINFLSERSFSSIYSRASFFMYIPIVLSRWNQDQIAALETLKGRVCIVFHKGDEVIPYKDSTHKALMNLERTRTYSCLELKEETAQESSSQVHNRGLTEQENKQIIAELKRMLKIPLTAEEESLKLESL